MARATVDLVSFSKGIGFSVFFHTFIAPNSSPSPILPEDKRLAKISTSFDASDEKSLSEIWAIVATKPEIFMALNDLISGIIYPHYGPRVIAQVVETLRGLVSPPGMPIKQQWPHMQRALNLDEAYLRFISNHGTGPRHGDRSHIPGDITSQMAVRGWEIMNRFLEYKKRGETALPESEFPILK